MAADDRNRQIAALYEATARRVKVLCWQRLADDEAASDTVQEVYERALIHWPTLAGMSDDKRAGWLMTVAANRCLDLLRHRQRFHRETYDPSWHDRATPHRDDQPETAALQNEQAASVVRLLASLPAEDATTLTIVSQSDGIHMERIAATFGIGRSAAKSRAYRARQRAQARLEAFGLDAAYGG